MKQLLISILAIHFLNLSSLMACGFKAEGMTVENEAKLRAALNQVTVEYELDVKSGEIHFTSKERIHLNQVLTALKEHKIQDVKVTEIAHH